METSDAGHRPIYQPAIYHNPHDWSWIAKIRGKKIEGNRFSRFSGCCCNWRGCYERGKEREGAIFPVHMHNEVIWLNTDKTTRMAAFPYEPLNKKPPTALHRNCLHRACHLPPIGPRKSRKNNSLFFFLFLPFSFLSPFFLSLIHRDTIKWSMFRYIQKRLLFINQGTVTLDVAINRISFWRENKIESSIYNFEIYKVFNILNATIPASFPSSSSSRPLLHPGKVRHGA